MGLNERILNTNRLPFSLFSDDFREIIVMAQQIDLGSTEYGQVIDAIMRAYDLGRSEAILYFQKGGRLALEEIS